MTANQSGESEKNKNLCVQQHYKRLI